MEQNNLQQMVMPKPTLSEDMLLDWWETFKENGDLSAAAARLVNEQYRKDYCKGYDDPSQSSHYYWGNTPIKDFTILGKYLNLFDLNFPYGFENIICRQNDVSRILMVTPILIYDIATDKEAMTYMPPIPPQYDDAMIAVMFLEKINHPALKWIIHYVKEYRKKEYLDVRFVCLTYLPILAIKEIMETKKASDFDPEFRDDFIMVSESWVERQKF